MTTPSSGPIAFSQIASEFGTGDYSLNDYHFGGTIVHPYLNGGQNNDNIPAGGAISFNQFYGQNAQKNLNWSNGGNYTYSGQFGWSIDFCANPYGNIGGWNGQHALNVTIGYVGNNGVGGASSGSELNFARPGSWAEVFTYPMVSPGALYFCNPSYMWQPKSWAPTGRSIYNYPASYSNATATCLCAGNGLSENVAWPAGGALFGVRINAPGRQATFYMNPLYAYYGINTGDNGTTQTSSNIRYSFRDCAGGGSYNTTLPGVVDKNNNPITVNIPWTMFRVNF